MGEIVPRWASLLVLIMAWRGADALDERFSGNVGNTMQSATAGVPSYLMRYIATITGSNPGYPMPDPPTAPSMNTNLIPALSNNVPTSFTNPFAPITGSRQYSPSVPTAVASPPGAVTPATTTTTDPISGTTLSPAAIGTTGGATNLAPAAVAGGSGVVSTSTSTASAARTANTLARQCVLDRIANVTCPSGSSFIPAIMPRSTSFTTNTPYTTYSNNGQAVTTSTTRTKADTPSCYMCPAGTFDHGHAQGNDPACKTDDGVSCAACGAFDEGTGTTGCAKMVATCTGNCAPCGRLDCPAGYGAPDCAKEGASSNACQLCSAGTFSPGGEHWFGDSPTAITSRGGRNCADHDIAQVDAAGRVCADYHLDPSRCGKFDTDQFNSSRLCCVCGGGGPSRSLASRFNQSWDCLPCTKGRSFASKPGSATCSQCHKCLGFSEEEEQPCSLTTDTVCKCKSKFTGIPSTARHIAGEGGHYVLGHPSDPCRPVLCTRPSPDDALLYDFSGVEEILRLPVFQVSGLTCAPGAYGKPVVTPCSVDGPYSVSGCSNCAHKPFLTMSKLPSLLQSSSSPNGTAAASTSRTPIIISNTTGAAVAAANVRAEQEMAQSTPEPATVAVAEPAVAQAGSGEAARLGISTDYRCPDGYYKSGSVCDGTTGHDTQTCTRCRSTNPAAGSSMSNAGYMCSPGEKVSGHQCDGTSTSDTQTCAPCFGGGTSGSAGGYACPTGTFQNGTTCDGGVTDTQVCSACDACDGAGQAMTSECTSAKDASCVCVRGYVVSKRGNCEPIKSYIEVALGFLMMMGLYDLMFMAGTSSAGASKHGDDKAP